MNEAHDRFRTAAEATDDQFVAVSAADLEAVCLAMPADPLAKSMLPVARAAKETRAGVVRLHRDAHHAALLAKLGK